MMTFDEWKITDGTYTLDDVPGAHSHIFDVSTSFDTVHIFADGSFFTETGGVFHCHVGISEIETPDIEEVRQFLWDNHSKYEVL